VTGLVTEPFTPFTVNVNEGWYTGMVPLRTLFTSVSVAGGDVTGEIDPDTMEFVAVNPL
jgi:hypothetical protein